VAAHVARQVSIPPRARSASNAIPLDRQVGVRIAASSSASSICIRRSIAAAITGQAAGCANGMAIATGVGAKPGSAFRRDRFRRRVTPEAFERGGATPA